MIKSAAFKNVLNTSRIFMTLLLSNNSFRIFPVTLFYFIPRFPLYLNGIPKQVDFFWSHIWSLLQLIPLSSQELTTCWFSCYIIADCVYCWPFQSRKKTEFCYKLFHFKTSAFIDVMYSAFSCFPFYSS